MGQELRADVVIVGGGLMGASSAFFLRQRGRSVILLERGLVGQQASGVNFGNVRRQGRFLPQLPLAHRSRAIWGRMKELIGDDAEFLATGHVRGVYTEAQAEVVEKYAADARGWGLARGEGWVEGCQDRRAHSRHRIQSGARSASPTGISF